MATWPCSNWWAQYARHVAVQRKQQHSGGAFVEPVHGVDLVPDLVAQHLQRKTGFVAVERAAMHQQPGRFVNGDKVIVAVEDGQGFGRGGGHAVGLVFVYKPIIALKAVSNA